LLVGALQDNKRATVIGANTFGKGSVQSILPLPSGAGLKLTTARYYTPSGHAIQADGIHPDIIIESGTKASQETPKVTRERDLPGHLAAEGPQGGGRVQDGGAIVIDGGIGDEVSGMLARDVPADPSSSRDVVLRVGYQTLRSQIAAKPASDRVTR
jgi:carboxyl-terminal processing protease